jgi:hypothetical protein
MNSEPGNLAFANAHGHYLVAVAFELMNRAVGIAGRIVAGPENESLFHENLTVEWPDGLLVLTVPKCATPFTIHVGTGMAEGPKGQEFNDARSGSFALLSGPG